MDAAFEEERFGNDEDDWKQYADDTYYSSDHKVGFRIKYRWIILVFQADRALKRVSSQPEHDSSGASTCAPLGAHYAITEKESACVLSDTSLALNVYAGWQAGGASTVLAFARGHRSPPASCSGSRVRSSARSGRLNA